MRFGNILKTTKLFIKRILKTQQINKAETTQYKIFTLTQH